MKVKIGESEETIKKARGRERETLVRGKIHPLYVLSIDFGMIYDVCIVNGPDW